MEFALGDLVWIYPHDELLKTPGEIIEIESDAYKVKAKDHSDTTLYRVEKVNAFPVNSSYPQSFSNSLPIGEFNEILLLHKQNHIDTAEKTVKSFLQTAIAISKLKNYLEKASKEPVQKFKKKKLALEHPQEKNLKSEPRKVNYTKELSEGKGLVIDTLQQEIKSLSNYLTREKEKNKDLQEELVFYKNNYQSTLAQVQVLQAEKQNFVISVSGNQESRSKNAEQVLQREINSKNNEIELLNLKLRDLQQHLDELEEDNVELKKKEGTWRGKFEVEMIKHTEEMQEFKERFLNNDMGRTDSLAGERELKGLKNTIKGLEVEVGGLKALVLELEGKNQDFLNSESRLKEQIKGLQEEISLRNENSSKVGLESMTSMKGQLAATSSELNQIIESQREENEALQDQLEHIKTEANRMSAMENYYKQELEKSKKKLKDSQNTGKDLESQIEDLNNQRIQFTRKKIESKSLKKLQKSEENSKIITDLKGKIEDQDIEIEEMATELENAKKIYVTLMTLLKFKNTEIDLYKQPERLTIEFNRELTRIKIQESELIERYFLFRLKMQTAVLNNEVE